MNGVNMGDMLLAVGVLFLGTYGLRLGGVLLGKRIKDPERAIAILDRGVIVLLMAVLVMSCFDGQDFAGWARPAGVAAGGLAALLKAPLLVVLVLALGVTAGLRALGIQ